MSYADLQSLVDNFQTVGTNPAHFADCSALSKTVSALILMLRTVEQIDALVDVFLTAYATCTPYERAIRKRATSAIAAQHAGEKMKMSHRLEGSNTVGSVSMLVFGMVFTAIGAALWRHATLARFPVRENESLAVAAILIGLFSAIYAGRELFRRRG